MLIPLRSEYTLDGHYCKREIPTALAVPIIYNTTDDTHLVITDETSTLISATLAVYAISALFREEDKEVLGLTSEEEITNEPKGSSGLSLGARIGIGIGATIGGLILIGLGLWVLCRKHKCKRSKSKGDATAVVDTRARGVAGRVSPLAYEFSQRNSMVEEPDSERGHNGEIQVLRAQKIAIQRRIEELEKVETSDDTRQG